MALVDELRKLHELQQIDTKIYQREQHLKALDSGESLKQQAIALLKQHDDATARLHHLSAELKDHELKLKTTEAKRDTVHARLYSGKVNNPKELGDLQADEDMLTAQVHQQEGPVLELMDQVEEAKTVEATLDGELAAAKRRWRDTVAHTQAETSRLQGEIAALRPERERQATQIDKTLLRRYDEIRSRREGLGLAVTATDNCPGCQIKLTSRVMNSLRDGEELTLCENCGRILFLLPS